MAQTTKPTREQLQRFNQERRQSKTPPPSPDEIRRQLGWHLIPKNTNP